MPLVELPSFPGDQIATSNTGGDLTVQACADDPQVAFHAIRQLAYAAGDDAAIRWAQAGFNETAAVDGTPRNLMGFKDGTINPTTDDELDQFVWADEGVDQPWMAGGTYLVVRRIRMLLDRWDAQTVSSQESVIGRYKLSGAPLGAKDEFAPLDLNRRGTDGRPAIAGDAHVRLTAPSENWGLMLLRRGYAYDNGMSLPDARPSERTLDAGMFFCAYQQNPRVAFIPMYANLAVQDALRMFTVHTASAIAAIPPGASGPAHWIGEQLLD
jgi:deferrochelatase/peroxidase EfeB